MRSEAFLGAQHSVNSVNAVKFFTYSDQVWWMGLTDIIQICGLHTFFHHAPLLVKRFWAHTPRINIFIYNLYTCTTEILVLSSCTPMDHLTHPTLETTDLDDLSNLTAVLQMTQTPGLLPCSVAENSQMQKSVVSMFASHKYRLSNYRLYSTYRFWF